MVPREEEKVHDDEGVIASTRGACAPQNRPELGTTASRKRFVPGTFEKESKNMSC